MSRTEPLLRCSNLTAGYGAMAVLSGVELEVHPGQLVCLLGSNGAGKTTLLKSMSGLVRPRSGEVVFDGDEIGAETPQRIVRRGLLHVAEGRRLFRQLEVRDNLELGLYGVKLPAEVREERYERVYELFPALRERPRVAAGALSGGQQQMLAIAQALMREPKLIMLDEPSLGLAPVVIEEVFTVLDRLRSEDVAVLLVEQIVEQALRLADHAYVMRNGSIAASGPATELIDSDVVTSAYLG